MEILNLALLITVAWISSTAAGTHSAYRFFRIRSPLDVPVYAERERAVNKGLSPLGYFFHNATRIVLILYIVTSLETPFLLSFLMFAWVYWMNVTFSGTVCGFLLATNPRVNLRNFLRYLLPHAIPEVFGICLLWSMILLRQWSTPHVALALSSLLVAGFIEAKISDPFFLNLVKDDFPSHQ